MAEKIEDYPTDVGKPSDFQKAVIKGLRVIIKLLKEIRDKP